MSPTLKVMALLPQWLRDWIQYILLPALGATGWTPLALGILQGALDMLMLIGLGAGFMAGGRVVMDNQYTLSRSTQMTMLKWAPLADRIAQRVDIPREVPLVLWFKENSMLAVNPDNCTGIMGAYDLVRSGEYPCFEPGPISDTEVLQQLAIGAMEFKKRCPNINYLTHDPEVIKRCYFAYNAGAGAAARLDPESSAYVMNNYDERYQGMVYSDVELGTVRVTAMGAWPTHLAAQSLLISQADMDKPLTFSLVDLSTRIFDRLSYAISAIGRAEFGNEPLAFPATRNESEFYCLEKPHTIGRPGLRPRLNPVSVSPILTQDVHGCHYGLPGVDISSDDSAAVLRAPMSGEVTTYTDQWYNTTIRIENDEWIVWMLHPRSYLMREGDVERGQPVGVMGAIGIATGPHVHYTVFDKVEDSFVDPKLFLP
jgi:hypothetical protein